MKRKEFIDNIGAAMVLIKNVQGSKSIVMGILSKLLDYKYNSIVYFDVPCCGNFLKCYVDEIRTMDDGMIVVKIRGKGFKCNIDFFSMDKVRQYELLESIKNQAIMLNMEDKFSDETKYIYINGVKIVSAVED
jgi:hypothetical protein